MRIRRPAPPPGWSVGPVAPVAPFVGGMLLALTVGLAACGGSDRVGDPAPGGATDAATPGRGTAMATAVDPLAAERAEAPLLGALVDPAGVTLVLYALAPGGDPVASGELVAAVQGADASAVHVLVRRPTEAGGAAAVGATAATGAVCRIEHDLHVVRLALPAPLGGRALIDDATGTVVAPMPQEAVLRPATLPAGWIRLDERPLREGGAQVGWAQRYGRTDAEPTVSLTQRLASLGPIDRYHAARTDGEAVPVRATSGTFSRQANWAATGLTWTEGAWTLGLDSSSPDGRQPPVDRAGLQSFAESLRSDLPAR